MIQSSFNHKKNTVSLLLLAMNRSLLRLKIEGTSVILGTIKQNVYVRTGL